MLIIANGGGGEQHILSHNTATSKQEIPSFPFTSNKVPIARAFQ
jgi:hypothetical protein